MPVKNNFFIYDERKSGNNYLLKFINKGLKKIGYRYQFIPVINPLADMNTAEQRINFYHLLTMVIDNKIPGQVVELGSFTGQCATLFQQILEMHVCDKELHLYDSFEHKFLLSGDIEKALLQNFKDKKLKPPVIHKGLFQDTLPGQLPAEIAFAHIDCGVGGDSQQHKEIVLYCLEHLYPRLSPGAICMLMDYHDDPAAIDPSVNCNPGVRMACDIFFVNRPEQIISLYGNEMSQAYFKKIGTE